MLQLRGRARPAICAEGDRRKATASAVYCGAAAGIARAADSYFGVTQRLRPQTPEELAAAAAEAERRAAEPYHGLAGAATISTLY